MVNMAKLHGIRVIVCSILPVSHFLRPQQDIYTSKIRALNTWLRKFASEQHLTYVDYYDAMTDQAGALRDSLSADGIHPNAIGYAIMQALAQSAIDKTP